MTVPGRTRQRCNVNEGVLWRRSSPEMHESKAIVVVKLSLGYAGYNAGSLSTGQDCAWELQYGVFSVN
ncbi:3-isopropylmalate dehydrogenase [Anopheles sinensis]|uniref:3-isopropylmalate dehydrogenase n=1 Tax=Anopheles sinensis TaxID=74873 RepID=A0A084W6J3_ANOSI|nr:3-isopropylmalate dehydrogenase [Anopheles sinensis]